MIHLSVQDIALLANLAGCCSSIDEFREYAVRTFGTDTSILSGQDEPAEFIVSYGSIDKIDLSPTQRQMMSAFNTINKLKLSPDEVLYKFNTVQTIDKLQPVVGSKDLADLATTIYAGIYKLKFEATDYKAYVYNTLVFKFIKGPVALTYNTVKSFLTPFAPASATNDTDIRSVMYNTFSQIRTFYNGNTVNYNTIDTIEQPRDERMLTINTIDKLRNRQHAEHGDLLIGKPVIYTAIDEIQHRQQLDRTNIYTAIDDLQHRQELDRPIVYTGIDDIQHRQQLDVNITYTGIDDIQHRRGMIDNAVFYTGAKILYHMNVSDSGSIVDNPVSYPTIDVLYHKPDEIDMSISHTTIAGLKHRNTPESQSTDDSISYVSMYNIEHKRPDMDMAGMYPTISMLRHDTITEPVDMVGGYVAMDKIVYARDKRQGMAKTSQSIQQLTYDSSDSNEQAYTIQSLKNFYNTTTHEDHLAHGVMSLKRIQYPIDVADIHVNYVQSVKDVKLLTFGDYLVRYTLSLSETKYYFPEDYLVHMIMSMDQLQTIYVPFRVGTTMGLNRVLYEPSNSVRVSYVQTLKNIRELYPSRKIRHYTSIDRVDLVYSQFSMLYYNTISRISTPSYDQPVSYTGIDDVRLRNRQDKTVTWNSISELEYLDIPEHHAIDYSTIGKHEHSCGGYVYCDDETYDWNSYCLDTTVDKYNMPVNVYGVSKIRITLSQHPIFDTAAFVTTDGRWLDLDTGAQLTPWATPVIEPNCRSTGWLYDNGHFNTNGNWTANNPLGPAFCAISEIRAIRNNETIYPLSGDDIIMEVDNCRIDHEWVHRGIFHTFELSSTVNGNIITTNEQLSAGVDGMVVFNEPMFITFHLPDTIDIRYIDIAPASVDGYLFHPPGWVQIEGYYPGCGDWFMMSLEHTPNRYLTSDDLPEQDPGIWNDLKRTWKPGAYTRFPIVNGIRRHKPKTMYDAELKRQVAVYDSRPTLIDCCNGCTVMGLSARPIWRDYHDRCGDGLYGVGTGVA